MHRFLFLGLTVLGLGLIAGLHGTASDATIAFGQRAEPREDRVPLEPGRIRLSDCRVKLVDEVELAAERTGILDFVVAEGTTVQADDVVARLRDDVPRAGLAVVTRQAQNDVDVRYARKAGELAQLEYVRALKANQSVPGTVSELELRQHRLAAEKALLQLEQAENALAIEGLKRDEAEATLSTYRTVAPFEGFVRKIYKKKGEAVREGDPILQIANTGRVRVEADLPVRDLPSVQPGMRVEVRPRLPGAETNNEPTLLSGRIAYVDVKVEPVSNTVKIWAEVRNVNNVLKDGLAATMIIGRE